MIDLYDELRKIVEALEQKGLDYAICGGIAVALHGYPRFTKDIDLIVHPDDLPTVLAVVAEVGFDMPGGSIPFRIGEPEEQVVHRVSKFEGSEYLTLDLLLVSPFLQDVWESRGIFQWRDRNVQIVSPAGLVKMKLAAGRRQDLLDLEKLGFGDAEDAEIT